MEKITTYFIHMNVTGRITQLPDSQKLFGALTYLYAKATSPKKATEMVTEVRKGNMYYTLSDLLPSGYLPLPQCYLLEQLNTENQNDVKKKYKAIKERVFIQIKQLKKVIAGSGNIASIYPYVRLKQTQQIHAAIDSLHYQLPGLDPNLYSVPEVIVLAVEKGGQEKLVTNFGFYLSVSDGIRSIELLQALNDALKMEKLFFLGNRASQGMNTYQITGIEEMRQSKDADYYLNLGMLLPEGIDFQESYLSLFTSQRRPYYNPEGWDGSQENRFISYIKAGSIIKLTNGRRSAGRCIKVAEENTNIIFGKAFLYPVKLLGGEKNA